MRDALPELIVAGDFVVKADWVLGPRELDEFELVYFPDGTKTEYEVNGRSYPLSRPCFVLTRPRERHAYRFDPGGTTRHLFVHFAWPLGEAPAAPLTILAEHGPSTIPSGPADIVPLLLRHLLEIAADPEERGSERCRLLLYTVLSELEALSKRSLRRSEDRELPRQMVAAREYIRRHVRQSSLTVAEVAEAIGLSHEHLTRAYKRCFGFPPREDILRQRIELACRLILEESWNMKRISYEVGFADVHYFSRCFRKMMGTPASRYREKYANPLYRHLVSADDATVSYPLNRYFRFASPQIK